MNNTILNNGLPKFPPASTATGSSTASTNTTTASSSTVPAATDDRVNLTDSALALQQAARADQSTAIDPKRVEQVRQALANGSYTINPGRIADGLLAIDQQLGGTGKA